VVACVGDELEVEATEFDATEFDATEFDATEFEATADWEAVGVSAIAGDSLLAFAKRDPPRMTAPATTRVAIGNFLLTRLIPAYESPL
jgi:hypothetical protein